MEPGTISAFTPSTGSESFVTVHGTEKPSNPTRTGISDGTDHTIGQSALDPPHYPNLSAGSGFGALDRDHGFAVAFLTEFQDRLLFGSDNFDSRLHDLLDRPDLEEPVRAKILGENAARPERAAAGWSRAPAPRDGQRATELPVVPPAGHRPSPIAAYCV